MKIKKLSKVEFLTRMEAAKEKLPSGIVPLYMVRHPQANRVRVSNTINNKTYDEEILKNVEKLVELITSNK